MLTAKRWKLLKALCGAGPVTFRESIKGRILIIPTTKGGVAGGWAFFDLLHKGIAPIGLLFGKLNPVMVQGAVLARMAISEGWSENALQLIRTGDRICLDPQAKTITRL